MSILLAVFTAESAPPANSSSIVNPGIIIVVVLVSVFPGIKIREGLLASLVQKYPFVTS